MITLTDSARLAAGAPAKNLNLVLEIEGVGTVYGMSLVKAPLLIGDSDFFIGEDELSSGEDVIGGLDEIEDQNNAITMDGTTTQINQVVNIDLGQGTSISNMQIALMDGDGQITKLITPGAVITDILQTRCKVYLGFTDVGVFPDDYIVIFRGVVTDVTSDAGKVVVTINHPDDKKQGSTYAHGQHNLVGAILAGDVSITLEDISDLLQPVTGPNGMIDASYESLLVIENEIIKYTGITGTTLTGCTRGYLGTTAVGHSDTQSVSSIHHLKGDPISLALKIMASTGDGSTPYLASLAATSFVDIDVGTLANAIYFASVDIVKKYNVQVGDWVTTTGATNGANNLATPKQISSIVETSNGGCYIVLSGTALVAESPTGGKVSFISQYNTLPDGLSLVNDDIDFDQHLYLQTTFLSGFTYEFYLKAVIDDTRKFIETEIYLPIACFSLPSKSRCSVGYHIGPIPGVDIKTFDATNIKNPDKVKIQRTTNRNFYNEILYQFEEDLLTDSQFNAAVITISEDSKAQIKGTDKTFAIQSKGLRQNLDGGTIAASQSNRRLNWYKYAAELLSIGVLYGDGYNVEIGDIVFVDGSLLKIPDIKTGLKGMAGRYFFVQNKKINLKSGDIQLDLLDTNFAAKGRYGLISPSSTIASAASTTQFTIQQSFSGKFGADEFKKWAKFGKATVRVRAADFSVSAETNLVDISSNVVKVSPALPWTPSAGYIMELPPYNDETGMPTLNNIYVSMSDTSFSDGKKQFIML